MLTHTHVCTYIHVYVYNRRRIQELTINHLEMNYRMDESKNADDNESVSQRRVF